MDKENKMLLGKAFYILRNIESAKFTETEKVEALRRAMDAVTINAITKEDLRRVIKYLLRYTIVRNLKKETREEYVRNCGTVNMARLFYECAVYETLRGRIKKARDKDGHLSCEAGLIEVVKWLQEKYWDADTVTECDQVIHYRG